MTYKDFGLVNTKQMFSDANARNYAIPAFNFYNMETLRAILTAVHETNSPVILSVSESALKYMGGDLLMGMIAGCKFRPGAIALHLDHGSSVDACKHAIDLGFSSVMIDGSALSIDENILQTIEVVKYAKSHDVTVEAELGVLAGIEDENTQSEYGSYTNPADVVRFVNETGCDSLAIAIGTSHGAYKRKSDSEELRFDILEEIAKQLPDFPLVLHGASSIPGSLVETINKFGGDLNNARGIPDNQIRRAVKMNICKINVDSDARLAFTAALRKYLAQNPTVFDPRKYLTAAMDLMKSTYMHEIREIMNSADKIIC